MHTRIDTRMEALIKEGYGHSEDRAHTLLVHIQLAHLLADPLLTTLSVRLITLARSSWSHSSWPATWGEYDIFLICFFGYMHAWKPAIYAYRHLSYIYMHTKMHAYMYVYIP